MCVIVHKQALQQVKLKYIVKGRFNNQVVLKSARVIQTCTCN